MDRRDSTTTPPPRTPSKRHGVRATPPDVDFELSRRRAQSEVVRNDLTSGKWRIVGAWSSLRRSLDTARRPGEAADPPDHPSQLPSPYYHARLTDRRDSTLDLPPPSAPPERPARKRVSLFLRRRRTPRNSNGTDSSLVLEPGEPLVADPTKSYGDLDVDEEAAARALFRRAQSHLVKPVAASDDVERGGGEGGRYLQYAAEFDDDSFERLVRCVRPGAVRIVASPSDRRSRGGASDAGTGTTEAGSVDENGASGHSGVPTAFYVERDGEFGEDGRVSDDDEGSDEIIGEICLEDFADAGSEDFDFLENQSVDLSVLEPDSFGRLPRRPSLKLDSQKVRWIGNEAEFAAFFAEVGLDEWFDVERPVELKEFDVSDEVLQEWKEAADEHNAQCQRWESKAVRRLVDIRDFERDFRDARRRRERRRRAEGAAAG